MGNVLKSGRRSVRGNSPRYIERICRVPKPGEWDRRRPVSTHNVMTAECATLLRNQHSYQEFPRRSLNVAIDVKVKVSACTTKRFSAISVHTTSNKTLLKSPQILTISPCDLKPVLQRLLWALRCLTLFLSPSIQRNYPSAAKRSPIVVRIVIGKQLGVWVTSQF
jgi:hypothetical protein